MCSKDGSCFETYQGLSRRRSSASAGWWPCSAYQTVTRDWTGNAKGAVRRAYHSATVPSPPPRSAPQQLAGRDEHDAESYRWAYDGTPLNAA